MFVALKNIITAGMVGRELLEDGGKIEETRIAQTLQIHRHQLFFLEFKSCGPAFRWSNTSSKKLTLTALL